MKVNIKYWPPERREQTE